MRRRPNENPAPAATQKRAGHDDLPTNVRTAIIRSKIPKPGREERIFLNHVGSFCKPMRNMRIMPQNKIRSLTIVDGDPGIANGTSESESGGENMKTRNSLYLGVAAVAIALAFGVAPTTVVAQQATTVSVGATDIGGVVRGPNGPEAGVWVIAETTDLPTKMNKTVVTDDQGRYLIPDLPKANYIVWARGYGLVDSARTQSEPGKIVNIAAIPAPSEAPAAEHYPAIYWYAMLVSVNKHMFPGTGSTGNRISP